MNNVKIARNMLWVLILTAVSQGFAMENEAVKLIPASATDASAILDAETATKLVEEAAKQNWTSVSGIVNHFKAFGKAITNYQDFTPEFLNKNPQYLTYAKQGALGIITLISTRYLVVECGKALIPLDKLVKAKAKVEEAKAWAKEHPYYSTSIAFAATAAVASPFAAQAVRGFAMQAINQAVNLTTHPTVALGVTVLAVAQKFGLIKKGADLVRAYPKTSGSVATGIAAAGAAHYMGWLMPALSSVTSFGTPAAKWVQESFNALPTSVKIGAPLTLGAAVLAHQAWNRGYFSFKSTVVVKPAGKKVTVTPPASSSTPSVAVAAAAPASNSYTLWGYVSGANKEAAATAKAEQDRLATAKAQADAAVKAGQDRLTATKKALLDGITAFVGTVDPSSGPNTAAINAHEAALLAQVTSADLQVKIRAIYASLREIRGGAQKETKLASINSTLASL